MRVTPGFFFVLSLLTSLVSIAGTSDPFEIDQVPALRSEQKLLSRIGERPCANSLPETKLTALDAVDLALCNHSQTREIWANARSQAFLLGAAKGAWLPTLDARWSEARIYDQGNSQAQRSTGLTLSWLMFDSGGRAANELSAQSLLEVANATRSSILQTLIFNSLQAYYAAQAAQAALVASDQAERAAYEGALAADVRYKAGVATPADRLQAQTAMSQAVLNRVRADGAVRTTLGVLMNAMGFDAHSPVMLSKADTPPDEMQYARDLEQLVIEARQRRPDLRAAEAQWNAARAAVGIASASSEPTLSLGVSPTWQKIAGITSDGGTLGVTLNVPLFTGFSTHYRTRAAEAQVELRDAQRERLRSQIALDVWRAYQNLQTSIQALKATRDLVESAVASQQVALGRYKAGVGTILDLLNAQAALANANSQRIQSVFDWQLARTALAQAMGTLDYGIVQGGLRSENGTP